MKFITDHKYIYLLSLFTLNFAFANNGNSTVASVDGLIQNPPPPPTPPPGTPIDESLWILAVVALLFAFYAFKKFYKIKKTS